MAATGREGTRGMPARRPALLAWLPATLLVALLTSGCAQFGVPRLPPVPAAGPWPAAAVYVAYDPQTVLGFGHTGVIVPAMEGGGWLRFDQYASAELAYGERLRAGTAHSWEAVTARLPSIFGLTRERVTRLAGPSPAALLVPGEGLLRIPGLDAAAVRRAAEARHAAAGRLEAAGAPRYWWTFNNCQHFVRDVLRAGGTIHEDYFPKSFVESYLPRKPPASPSPGPTPEAVF